MFSSRSLSRFADIVSLCIQTEPEFRPTMSDIVESLELLNDRSSADGLSFYIRYEAAITLKNSCLSLKDVALGDILQIFNIVVTLKKWNVVHANDWQPITITVGYGGGATDEDFIHPCLERLQKLEALVIELTNKPVVIPPEKDIMLLESMNRIKSIEYDLQKTRKALHATASKQMQLAEGKDLAGKEIEDPLPENSNYSFTTPQILVLGLAALSCWCKCMYLSKLEHLRSVSLSDFP
ncbi:hypothetical protein IFM89_036302 [Coptis chinensis]|uniref:Uncharacterized protein n=1 Tax=Coptis chinensis TaxID=261450 RepID=A0A835MB72_9MAGN|nr:hypothetical protein IFM89_036302 [Coptis chinensis]